jgi:outer membrane protein assembly factor BamE (lipoprotein component of BamABCDE complex)
LIERHEVVVGMTRREVRAGLGRPDQTAGIRTRQGDEEQWFYTIYKYLPYYTRDIDANGNPRQQVRYRREASGHKVVTFHNDEVVEVAEQQEEKRLSPSITVLPGRPVN